VREELRAIVGPKGHGNWLAEVEVLTATEREEVPRLCLADLLTLVGHRLYQYNHTSLFQRWAPSVPVAIQLHNPNYACKLSQENSRGLLIGEKI
jgi:hypothetical protein